MADRTTGRAVRAIHDALDAIQEVEDRLRKERDFAQGILETAQAVILVLDTEGKIVSFNPFMESLSGWSLEEVSGLSWFDTFIPDEDRDRIQEVFFGVLENPEPFKGYVNPILTKDGDLVCIEWTSAILVNGEVTGVLSVGIDVTERDRLEQAREALERRKYQFVANVGHELRTPLSLLKGYTRLMIGGDADFSDLTDLNQQQREIMTLMLRRTEELGHLVDDLLTAQELSDPEAFVYVRDGTVCLVDMVTEVYRAFRPVAEQKGLDMICHCPQAKITVRGSAKMIGRAVTNLVMNAIKFTDAGEVAITCRVSESLALIEVDDTGIGIDPTHHEEIFERFYQVDGMATRRFGGSGIGLHVVQTVMEAHGGSVEVESALGAGSTFRLVFPLIEAEAGPAGCDGCCQ